MTLFIIAIWLGILCLLVKMDVGGFGSNVLTPILKDVPVINKILPSESGTETTKDKAYGGYNSIKDAVEEINNLQKQMETLQNNNTYRTYYEEMDPTTAEALYKQVIQEEAVNNKMKDYVATYSSMEASKAAAILSAMTDNLNLAAEILESLSSSSRAAIMAEMDPSIAARLTKIMNPNS